MQLFLDDAEKPVFSEMQKTFTANAAVLRLFASYLRECPALVTPEMIGELTASTGARRADAFSAVLAAAFDLDEERGGQDARLVLDYLPRAVQEKDTALYEADPYFQNIRVPQKRKNGWSLTRETYAPYEGFVCGHYVRFARWGEVPPIGYFTKEFSFPAVMQNGVEWMAVKPNEIETMRAPLADARGDVLTYGLGLGYYTYMASLCDDVSSVTVVERDPAVIALFREELLPQFPHGEKITVIEGDALIYAESEAKNKHYDTVFADLWHDTGDGLPLYLRLRRAEKKDGSTHYSYWIEDQLLSCIRAMVFSELSRAPRAQSYSEIGKENPKNGEKIICGLDAVKALLSDEGIRQLALSLTPRKN